MAKVTFPSLVSTLKRQENVLRKETKKRGVVLLSPAIDSASVKKHNRVKSVLKSGEDPSGGALFFFFPPPQRKGDPLFFLCPQHPRWGLSSIHGAKWSRERYATMKLEMWNVPLKHNKRKPVYVPHPERTYSQLYHTKAFFFSEPLLIMRMVYEKKTQKQQNTDYPMATLHCGMVPLTP